MSKMEAFHEWELNTTPNVTVQMPTAEVIKSVQKLSQKTDNGFMAAMLKSAGDDYL